MMGPLVVLSGDAPELHHAEPHLSVRPGNPRHLLVGAVVFPDSLPHRVDAFVSRDGGSGWARESLPMPAAVADQAYIDPWGAIGADGAEYMSVLARAGDGSRKVVPWLFGKRPGDVWRRVARVDSPGRGSFDQQKIAVDVVAKARDGLEIDPEKINPRLA